MEFKFLLAALLAAMVSVQGQPMQNANADPCPNGSVLQGKITVSGNGIATALPDLVTVYLTVTATGTDAESARVAAANATNATLNAIYEAGVPKSNISTTSIHLYPEQITLKNGSNQISGYTFSQSLKVDVANSNASTISNIIDGVVLAGGNSVQISSISTNLSPTLQKETTAQAKQQAVADGMSNAQLLSQAANVTLGPVTLLSDMTSPMPIARSYDNVATRATVPTPILIGTKDIQASVNMEFAICSTT